MLKKNELAQQACCALLESYGSVWFSFFQEVAMSASRSGSPYCVYVVELLPEVRYNRRFRKRNSNMKPDLPCVYVGQTSQTAEERFKKHKSGHKSSWFVREFGVHLLPQLCREYQNLSTREQAEQAEMLLGEMLRVKGYGVWYN